MEKLIKLRIERLDKGGYLATSEDFADLLAQGETIEETLDIAKDVAKKLLESYIEHGDPLPKALMKRQPEKTVFAVPVEAAA